MKELKLLISYLKGDDNFDIQENFNIKTLYSICKLHNILPIMYVACEKYNINLSFEIKKGLEKSYKNAVYQEAVRDVELNEILNVLSKNNIKVLPLKGSVLKFLYPSCELRTMCDIDILYDDNKDIKNLMMELGYKLTHKSNHHDVYEKAPFMNVEMHHHLISEDFNMIRNYYDNIWNVVNPINDNSSIYKMSNEDFYIFMITHIAKHFQYGGIGIRYVFDEYVFLEKYKEVLDFEYIKHELDKINLRKFEENFRLLMEIWFYDRESDKFFDEMSQYLIESTVHGTSQHVQMLKMAIGTKGQHTLKSNKIKYLWNRVFPDFTSMKYRNPILKKIPLLLPFFYIERIFTALFTKRKQTYYEITGLQNFNIEKAKTVQDINNQMGFENKK